MVLRFFPFKRKEKQFAGRVDEAAEGWRACD